MTYPKLSIITPSYNQAAYLEQAILSVLQQEYPNLEYFVVDGGSSDGSVDILKKYSNRLAYWVSERDRGQSHALNKGFAMTTGEWVGWLNSDDYYLPGALDAVAATVSTAYPSVGLVFGRGLRVDPDGREIAAFWPRDPVFDRHALLYGADYILQPTAFIRRDAWVAVGPLDEDLHYCMDYDLWLRLSETYEVATMAHPIAAAREHPASKTATGQVERWLEIYRMICRHSEGSITPGAVLYLLDTLRGLTRNDRTAPVFGNRFHRALDLLWRETLMPLSAFSKPGDWLPTSDGRCPTGVDPVQWMTERSTGAAVDYWEVVAAMPLRETGLRALTSYAARRISHGLKRRIDVGREGLARAWRRLVRPRRRPQR